MTASADEDPEIVFPTREIARRGPPAEAQSADEKWARVVVVAPVASDSGFEFAKHGPYTRPMARRRKDSELGSEDAWEFFTHTTFPAGGCFYNIKGKGCVGARLVVPNERGVVLFDEVGAGFSQAEMVAKSYHGALGVMRDRVLGHPDRALASPYTSAMLALDHDLIRVLHHSTQVLRTSHPSRDLRTLHRIVHQPTASEFFARAFSPSDLDLMTTFLAEPTAANERRVGEHFQITKAEFVKVTDIRDAAKQQAVVALLQEWEELEQAHRDDLNRLRVKISEEEEQQAELSSQLDQMRQDMATTRFLSRGKARRLLEEAAESGARMRALEAELEEIPGYTRLHNLATDIREFEASVHRIYELCRSVIDHNVKEKTLTTLRDLPDAFAKSTGDEEKGEVLRRYHSALSREALPRVLTTYSLSAYLIRRPDSLPPRSSSFQSLQRINIIARRLIEYFRFVRMGKKTLGDLFDEGWGQVLSLEARL